MIDENQSGEVIAAIQRIKKSTSLPGSATDLLSFQSVLGNQGVQRLLGKLEQPKSAQATAIPAIQRKLPPISPPAVTTKLSYPANLTKLAQSYLNRPSTFGAQSLVNAVANWLQTQGLVNYKSPDIVAGSPQFMSSPSGAAKQLATQKKMDLSSAAGFAYSQNNQYKVEIYERALTGNSANELIGTAASYITHEYIHILQYRQKGHFSEAQSEFQAYLWQAEHAVNLGIPLLGTAWEEITTQLENYYKQLPGADRQAYKARYVTAYIAIKFPSLLNMVERMRGNFTQDIAKDFLAQLKEYYGLLPGDRKGLYKKRYLEARKLLTLTVRRTTSK
ncbi:MAG: hypothetical protein JXA78_11730 [Anaerolineales bacterium]|nr:hypothetical protein [Anaerolineales bacterium]